MLEQKKNWFSSNVSGILITCVLAILFRIFLFEPFHIPSGSMKPNLLVGDYVFVNKMSYGYSKYSIPFHPDFLNFNIWRKLPKVGDVAVFVPPKNPSLYYVKRVIALPGDIIEIKDGKLYVNDKLVLSENHGEYSDRYIMKTDRMLETNGSAKYDVIYTRNGISFIDATYKVPKDALFVMGDNRDNSMDSRFQDEIGFIPINNLVGKVSFIGFSINEKENKSIIEGGAQEKNEGFIHKIKNFIRFDRFFHSVK